MPYNINNQAVNLPDEPVVRNGKHYVPLEPLVQQLGGQTAWDDASKTARATIGQWTAAVQMANQTVDVNGKQVNLTAPPFVENGHMYVPFDFFRDAYGYKVNFQNDTVSIGL